MITTSNNIKQHGPTKNSHRALALLTGSVLSCVGIHRWWELIVAPAVRALLHQQAPVRPVDAVLVMVSVLSLALASWFVLGVLLELLSLVPGLAGRAGRRMADLVGPQLARRVVAASLGLGVGAVSLSTAPVAAAVAAQARPATTAASLAHADHAMAGAAWSPATLAHGADHAFAGAAWTASPPAVRTQPEVSMLTGPVWTPGTEPRQAVIRRGDSLWSLAAAHLGPGATQAEIAREWPRWHEANLQVIGPDPDLLLPGQVLRIPPTEASQG